MKILIAWESASNLVSWRHRKRREIPAGNVDELWWGISNKWWWTVITGSIIYLMMDQSNIDQQLKCRRTCHNYQNTPPKHWRDPVLKWMESNWTTQHHKLSSKQTDKTSPQPATAPRQHYHLSNTLTPNNHNGTSQHLSRAGQTNHLSGSAGLSAYWDRWWVKGHSN